MWISAATPEPVDPTLWGMPLELAVGLIGFGGAALGVIASLVLAIFQRRHERDLVAAERLRDRAAILMTASTRLAHAASAGKVAEENVNAFQEALLLVISDSSKERAFRSFADAAFVALLEEVTIGDGRPAGDVLKLMPDGGPWEDLWALAMSVRKGAIDWMSDRSARPHLATLLAEYSKLAYRMR